MAIVEGDTARERTRREAINEMLLKAVTRARQNNEAVLRLQNYLYGTPPEKQAQARPVRSGWLGEIVDSLEVVIEHLEDTAKVLEEISQQVSPEDPTFGATKG